MPGTSRDRQILKNLVKHAQNEDEDPLTPLIEDYFLKRVDPRYDHLRIKTLEIVTADRPRPPGRISPSNAGGCARLAAFTFAGAKGKKRIDPDQEMIFEDGKWRHHKWGYIFLEMERFFPKRLKVISIEESVQINDLYVAGSLDITVKVKMSNGKWRTIVIDFKGANTWAFEDAVRTDRPNPRYVLQLITYLKSKRKKYGYLLFESKDKNRFFLFPVTLTDRKWAEVSLWTKEVIDHLERRKLPPRDPECDNGKFLYGKCPFASKCFGKETDRQVEHEVFVNFPGVDKMWKRGHRIIEEYNDALAG